jgi:hypothetical protein
MTNLPIRSALLLALATACTITKGDLGNFTATDSDGTDSDGETDGQTSATGGTTGGTDPSGTTGGTDPTNGTSDGTTGGTSEGTASTNGTASSSDTDGPACAEPAPGAEGSYTITVDPPLPFEQPPNAYSATCTALAVDSEGSATFVALDCVDRMVTIEMQAGGWLAPVGLSDELAFKYHRSMPWWENEWFTVRAVTEGAPLIAGGLKADSLLPLDDDDMTLFSPVQLAFKDGVCGVPTSCDNQFERLLVEYKFDGDTLELADGNSGLVGLQTSYKAILKTAEKYHDMMECSISDVPAEWFSGLILLIPEG